ncbi:MAG: PQQ-binding-like beta-propeller repeat protein [Gammaproteobacteria bacterium]|nr:PQQ-binding-like beta-propeller repeat protein [Gammaproteobacteria bacterium]
MLDSILCLSTPSRGRAALPLSLALAAGALAGGAAAWAAEDGEFVPVNDAMLEDPDPSDWLMWRGTPNSWGFSELDQIDRGNVSKLEPAWTRELEAAPSQEGIPLVYRGVLYYPQPMDVTTAMDAATGETLWEHRRDLPEDVGRYVPFPQTNRNLAIYGRLIIDNGSDDYVYAIDAETGELAWETRIFDYRTHPAKQGSGPLVADGKLISGRNCMPEGGPDTCVITAHDAVTGEELWRRRTIPRPGEPGADSWGDVPDDERWHVGSWLVPSYDADLGLVYVGTSVTAPAPKFMLAGNDRQYLHHNSTLALNVDTGEIEWFYQHLVDHWDLDHPYERMLIDTAVAPNADDVPWINPRLRAGERRRVLTGIPGKTGLVYTLDRATGEFLWARPTIEQNVVAGIDGATGRVDVNPETLFTAAGQERFVCPTTNGGKNWPAGAYSPRTRTMYFAMANTCMRTTSVADEATPELVYAIDNETFITPGTEQLGTLRAISVESGSGTWRYDQRAAMTALLATAGDVVFGGDLAGTFRAFDAETGEVLWEYDLGAPVTGHPVTFAVDGTQYVSISTGRSNMSGALARLTPDAEPASRDSKLVVFALPAGD